MYSDDACRWQRSKTCRTYTQQRVVEIARKQFRRQRQRAFMSHRWRVLSFMIFVDVVNASTVYAHIYIHRVVKHIKTHYDWWNCACHRRWPWATFKGLFRYYLVKLYSCAFKFCKVVRQQTWAEVVVLIPPSSAVDLRIQQWKNY